MSATHSLARALRLGVQLGDQVLGHALERPRALQITAVSVCGLLLVLSFTGRGAVMGVTATPSAVTSPLTPDAPAKVLAASDELQTVAAVERYNQASAEAARRGDVGLLAPHLAPDGDAWAAVRAEYARRSESSERHDPTLRRWGVLSATIHGDAATVVTQELWDDVVRIGGVVTASERGILSRNTYTLRRDGVGWVIVDVAGDIVVR